MLYEQLSVDSRSQESISFDNSSPPKISNLETESRSAKVDKMKNQTPAPIFKITKHQRSYGIRKQMKSRIIFPFNTELIQSNSETPNN